MEKIDMEKRIATNKKIFKVFGILFASLIMIVILAESFGSSTVSDDIVETKALSEISTAKGIIGMSPVDVYLDLEKKGYAIDKQYIPNEGTMYNCDKKEFAITYNVRMFKNENDLVEEVRIAASITGQDNKSIVAVKPFLKYISTVSYEGSDTSKITQWIEENFNKESASIVIGKAKFTLSGNKFSKVVQIEPA
jgi:hypothetical protein